VVDKTAFDLLRRFKIKSIHFYKKNEWHGSTLKGDTIIIKYHKGYLMVGYGETEYEATSNFAMVGFNMTFSDSSKLSNILDFLGWKVSNENIWDN
jgi:hypothetical protein